MTNCKFPVSVLFPVLVSLMASTAIQADTLEKIIDTNQSKLKQAASSQRKIDQVYSESENLLNEYRDTVRRSEALEIYIAQMKKQLSSQETIISELDQSINKVAIVERQLPRLMEDMLSALEQFVALDAPFHREERQQRLQHLKTSFARADISMAEKFRQLLEAYKIENEYGRKLDSYEDQVEIGGELRTVNVLRVGRIALLYQTRDRLHAGVWDRSKQKWLPLDNAEYRDAIVKGLRIAKNQMAIDLLQLPVQPVEDEQ